MMNILKVSVIALGFVAAVADGAKQSITRGPTSADPTPTACATMPKLCTGEATMNGAVSTLTYVCAEQSTTTTTITVFRTVEVTPSVSKMVSAPAPTATNGNDEDVTTTELTTTVTINSKPTLFITKTVQLASKASDWPSSTNLLPETSSAPKHSHTSSDLSFPTLTASTNGTTSGISYTQHPSGTGTTLIATNTGYPSPTGYPTNSKVYHPPAVSAREVFVGGGNQKVVCVLAVLAVSFLTVATAA